MFYKINIGFLNFKKLSNCSNIFNLLYFYFANPFNGGVQGCYNEARQTALPRRFT